MAANLLFIDTSAFYAFFDKSDVNHERVVNLLRSRSETFITSNFVIDELITLLRVRRLAVAQIQDFIDSLLNEEICQVVRVSQEIEIAAWKLLQKYHDQNFSFTDCTSFVLMKQLTCTDVCTLDSDFCIAGFVVVP